ncbi:MAG: DHH family phosphoesterase [Oscillospiraceae bacterium]|nr:DHH family phosphoesterase [Oscillospiraceae bacterium]
MTIQESVKWLASHDNYLLLTHLNPDGDTVMSAAALCRALRRKNKKACLYRNPQITAKQLPFVEKLFAPEDFEVQNVVAVDLATEKLFPEGFDGAVDFCIDHHPSNSHYAKNEIIEPECSSCGEIILKLIKSWTGKLTKNEATLLYIALTTDTGAFQYANVNAESYRAAAALMDAGAEHSKVMMHFFRKTSLSRLKLEGMIYSSLHYYRDGKIVVALVTQKMMKEAGANEDDCDDLAGLSGRAENARINVTIRELKDGSCKVSVRSAPGVSSEKVCEVLGGGGHELAAGCTIQDSPEKAEKILVDVIETVCGDSL